MFRAEHGRGPLDAREISGYLARISRPAPLPVAGYDLTFCRSRACRRYGRSRHVGSPRRSRASTRRPSGHDRLAGEARRLHPRRRRRHRPGRGHRADRGRLHAPRLPRRRSRSAHPRRRLEQGLHRRWSMAVAGRTGPVQEQGRRIRALQHPAGSAARRAARRPVRRPRGRRRRQAGVREIVGVDEELLRFWSSRRGDIEAELAVLARRFQEEHSRPPTVIERQELAQQATLSTRAAKHEPRSEAEQRRTWRADAGEILGGAGRVDDSCAGSSATHPRPAPTADVDILAQQVITTVEASRATWQEHHVRAEAERACRRLAAVPDFLVDAVTDRALSPTNSVLLTVPPVIDEPPELRRANGSSVYEVAGSRRYTSAAILDAERRILGEAAARTAASRAAERRPGAARSRGERRPARPRPSSRWSGNSPPPAPGCSSRSRRRAPARPSPCVHWPTLGPQRRTPSLGWRRRPRRRGVLREETRRDVPTDTLAKLVHAITTGSAVPDWVDAIDRGPRDRRRGRYGRHPRARHR